MRSLTFRLHEWLADRLPWMQYPSQRFEPAAGRASLPWYMRVFLFFAGILLIGIAGIALFLLALFAWSALTA